LEGIKLKNLQLSHIIAKGICGEIIQGPRNGIINNVATRLRNIKNNTLYFNIDKNLVIDYKSIPKNNLSVIVTDNPKKFKDLGENTTLVKVKNINYAYWKFIDYYRSQFKIPVIGVTGTCGKTTTKEMIKHILSSKYRKVVATYKSFNYRSCNLKYLMKINEITQAAVIEMGITYPGDLPIYCRYFRPQIGVITTIGVDHLNKCKTLENYIKEKSKLLSGLRNKGTLILNADDENTNKISLRSYKGKVVYFGFNKPADYAGSHLKTSENGIDFTLRHGNKDYSVSIPIFGDFNANNALAAIAAACETGIKIEDAVEKLRSYKNIEKHVQLRKGIKGCTIIDDTWSTNPTSAAAAIEMLRKHSGGRKTIAVLGRMNLLGNHSIEFHRKIGKQIAEAGINYLITTDAASKYIGKGAKENGMSADCIYNCHNIDTIMNTIDALLDENTVVLLKTSMLDSYAGLTDKLIIK
jgi:UDP-N-acetylmuramoyl-tripeptide--D-alanyl-D-alanine ligase